MLIFTIATNAFRNKTAWSTIIPSQRNDPIGGPHHVDPSPDLPGPYGRFADPVFPFLPGHRSDRGAAIMIHSVSLCVSFPVLGTNYYAQEFVSRKELSMVFDENFEALLMPAATNHFNNEVVGLNDQFRFLNDVLVEHLLEIELAQNAPRSSRQFTF
jgi:hypothetical protein